MTTFTKVHTVAVPVSDQDRSKAFFLELGLTEDMDAEIQPASGGSSWRSPAAGRRFR